MRAFLKRPPPGSAIGPVRAALILAAILLGAPAMAQPATMTVPGGQLDPAYPDADVFLAPPPPPAVPAGRACAVAKRYVDLIAAGDYAGVAALYADDAVFMEPMRPTLHGRAQIDDFYTKRIGSMKPVIAAVSYLGDDRECMVALARQTAIDDRQRYVLVSVDHFLVDEHGAIRSMSAFARPPRGPAAAR